MDLYHCVWLNSIYSTENGKAWCFMEETDFYFIYTKEFFLKNVFYPMLSLEFTFLAMSDSHGLYYWKSISWANILEGYIFNYPSVQIFHLLILLFKKDSIFIFDRVWLEMVYTTEKLNSWEIRSFSLISRFCFRSSDLEDYNWYNETSIF